MIQLIISALYFILPVYIANMVLVYLYFKYLKNITTGPLGWPLDFGIRVGKNKRPLIGPHKRFEGLVTTSLVAIVVVAIQRWLHPYLLDISLIDYQSVNLYLLGSSLGLGSALGDAAKSLIKRLLNFPPHSAFPLLDQIDHPLGALAVSAYWFWPGWDIALTILIMTVPLVLLVNFISYKLRIKDVWW